MRSAQATIGFAARCPFRGGDGHPRPWGTYFLGIAELASARGLTLAASGGIAGQVRIVLESWARMAELGAEAGTGAAPVLRWRMDVRCD